MSLSKTKVPHIGPLGASIVLLGEAPGEEEDFLKQPFVGRSGQFLDHLLSFTSIKRSDCRIANVLNYRPQDNEFARAKGTPQLEEGILELTSYLNDYPPRLIIAMGNEALRFCMGFDRISKWRGSVLQRDKAFVIPTYHPAAALRFGDMAPQIVFDFKKAERVLKEGYKLPVYNFHIHPPELSAFLPSIEEVPFVTCDIESIEGSSHVLSIGFAWSGKDALVIKNMAPIGEGMDEEFRRKCQAIFSAAKALTFHNGTFDVEVLRLNQVDVPIEKYDWDTMFAQRVLEPELPIGLDFCTSIYTDQAYYKDEGKQVGKKIPLTLYTYNGTDCVCTWQTRAAQYELLSADPEKMWAFRQDMEDLPTALDLQRNGMLIDQDRLQLLDSAVDKKLTRDLTTLFILAGRTFNHNSPKQVLDLFKELGLPIRTKKGGGETSGEDAVVSMLQYCKREYETKLTPKGQETWIKKMGVLKMLLAVRGHEKMLGSYLRMGLQSDGRVHSSYKLAGTETGRWASGLYVDGTGFNAMTPPREEIEVDGTST